MDAQPSAAAARRRSGSAPDPRERARALLADQRVEAARRLLEEDDPRTLQDQRELTEIPAPPFGEEARGKRMAELFAEAGLDRVETDPEGNVIGHLAPRSPASAEHDGWEGAVILSAHLDTVFPEGTDVRVRELGDRLAGPGISDDGRGLAALLALARVTASVELPLGRPLVFAATVGEEGAGDLRGVRYLFAEASAALRASAFISLDGAGMGRIVNSGLGSRRFRVTVQGPGGHSWVNFGTPNPIHALGAAVARWTELALPRQPQATLTVARWGGGTSINAIPQEAWVELELRCASEAVLDRLDAEVQGVLQEILDALDPDPAPGSEALRPLVACIGTRPSGETDPGAPLVRAASAATLALGTTPELAVSSTDANIPMSLGIPAITVGAGGEAGQAHTTEEWYRNVQGPDGILRALLTVLLLDDEAG